jgi:hypothetical protein
VSRAAIHGSAWTVLAVTEAAAGAASGFGKARGSFGARKAASAGFRARPFNSSQRYRVRMADS